MSKEIYDYESAADRIEASLWWPEAGTVRRLERACRMRDMILTLMHCYCMPPLIAGWLTYDFGFFQASVLMPQIGSDDFMQLKVWDDEAKLVLDFRWNEASEVRVVRFLPNWWEGEYEDINFWNEKTRWRFPDYRTTAAINKLCEPDDPTADLPYLRKRMANLRTGAIEYADCRMRGCYARGDRVSGDKWAIVISAISATGSPLTSDVLN